MRKRVQYCVVFGIACLASAVATGEAATLPRTAEIVPAETLFLIDIDDCNRLRAQFEKTALYKLYRDPAMSRFVGSFEQGWRDKLRQGDDPVLKTIIDANMLPMGRAAVAWVLTETGQSEELPILLISQWGANVEKVKEAVEKAAAGAVERGFHKAQEQYRDVNIVTLTKELAPTRVPDWESYKSEDGNLPVKTVQPPPCRTGYCFIDDCLVAGTDIESVKFVVAHLKGAAGSSLAGDQDYVLAMGAVGPYHDIDIYVNAKQFIKRLLAEDAAGRTGAVLSNLGFDNVSGLACSVGIGADADALLRGKAFLRMSGTKKGVLKMLDTRSEPIRPPRFVPGSAYSVTFLNVDIKRAYDEFCNMMYGFDPAEAMALQRPLIEPGPQGEPAVSLRSDIIEYLGYQIAVAQSINKPFAIGAMPTETLIAIAITDRGALERSLSVVHSRLIVPNNPEGKRELLGYTIYLLSPFGLPFFGGAVPMQVPGPSAAPRVARMAFTVTDTHLILGHEPAVERAIRTLSGAESESVGSARWFAGARSAVPSVVGLAGFEDNCASGELMWWMLKEGAKARRPGTGIGPAAALLARRDLWQLADFTLLPEFDAVRKYFGCSAYYGVSRADGFLFEVKYLNPRPSAGE